MIPARRWVLLVGALLPLAATRSRPAAALAPRGTVEGVASWYGWQHDGRPMANGKRFRALGLSAASRVLPLGTRIRVTNVENGRSLELPVTDRGPYVAGRILDVSLGAAKVLRMEAEGLAWVRIEVV